MVTTSGFTHVPVSRLIILSSIASSIALSILDIKHLAPIKLTPHLWPYLQFSRILTYQLAFTCATEVLVSIALLYQFRVLERIWGSRKYASFLVVAGLLNIILVPSTCLVLKLFTLGAYNHIPSGSTSLVFALLAAFSDEIPRLYRYQLLPSSPAPGSPSPKGITLSDKSTTYLLAAQLALSQFPYSVMPAAVGWVVGTAWQSDVLPGGMSRWRVPGWVVGESVEGKERGQYEGLRRRLEEEGSAADGMRNVSDQARDERRGFMSGLAGYFGGGS